MYRRAAGSQDPRTLRSRSLLQDALLEILRQSPGATVAVADLTERAGVNRSTFYQHYREVDDLLADALDARAVGAGADLESIPPDAMSGSEPPAAFLAYVEHIAANRVLYRRVLGGQGSPATTERLRRRLVDAIVASLQLRPPPATRTPTIVTASAMAGALLGVLSCWVELMPHVPAREAAGWAWEAVMRAAPDAT
ncbi:TetR/AcrR family transcriptional regulator [Georgenia faecalis]|uniref:TetR/AcrR family transcriptional regulator n=1 Tax=Georgenia faecalis TaxID=2483799 RepID=A0ABV9DA65_9MICO|nr:hypothetical protein [Georgenia faecalis]